MAEGKYQAILDALALASSPFPVAGDVAGVVADGYRYWNQPEERTPGNFVLSAAGVLPFVPAMGSVKAVGNGIVKMSPQDYLNLAHPFEKGYDPTARALTKTGEQKIPMLSVKQAGEEFQVGLHDGRHRAFKALLDNKKDLEVEIQLGKKFAREHPGATVQDLIQLIVERKKLLSEDGSKVVEVVE